MGKRLRRLLTLKSASHYGERLLDNKDRTTALRDASARVADAVRRTS